MIDIESRYLAFNRILLLALGIWPYQRNRFARLHFIFLFSILVTSIVFQLTALITSKRTLDLFVKISSTVFLFICFGIKYNSFNSNAEIVKTFLEKFQRVCNKLEDENEFAIIEKYGYISKQYTIGLSMSVMFSICSFIFVQTWPEVVHTTLPINESRSRRLLIPTEYFVDQETYFYLILFHMNAAFCIGIISWVATGTIMLAFIQYICGMFSISSYRIKHAMQIDIIENISLKNHMIKERIVRAIDMHRKAMKYTEDLISRFNISFFCMAIAGVLSLSFNLVRVVLSKNIGGMLLPSVFILPCILYMFFSNYMGQNIIDHNKQIFTTAYSIQWYMTPLYTQKSILFLLQRGSKSFYIQVGGLFIASLQCFATLLNTSLSYFTVMYSIKS